MNPTRESEKRINALESDIDKILNSDKYDDMMYEEISIAFLNIMRRYNYHVIEEELEKKR